VRLLHAIHDFLPKHRAGSEIYAYHLCRALSARHDVWVACAEYDPSLAHGQILRREFEGLPVREIANNWAFADFAESYRAPAIARAFAEILDEARPDVVHFHSLLNLSLELPALARAGGVPSVATLHDFTLVCPSGGQRVHLAERHVCVDIDPDRCRRCFAQTHFHAQMVASRQPPARPPARESRVARFVRKRLPRLRRLSAAPGAANAVRPVTAADIERRLDKLRDVYDSVALFVAPSSALAADFRRFGMPADKLEVSDYGFAPLSDLRPAAPSERLRIGYVGTLVWHKGVHVLVEAARGLPPDRIEVKLFGNMDYFPDYVASLRSAAAGLPIRFMGAFGDGGAGAIYSEIDVLVVSSLWPENSPLVIHEAFQAGVPVVGARTGGIPGLVTHGETGLLYEPTSAEDLAAALRSLADDRGLLRRLAAKPPRVKTIEEDAAEWEARYWRVLERSRDAASSRTR
jgi:glycosyltransferase involved in cell wall biosynthesis